MGLARTGFLASRWQSWPNGLARYDTVRPAIIVPVTVRPVVAHLIAGSCHVGPRAAVFSPGTTQVLCGLAHQARRPRAVWPAGCFLGHFLPTRLVLGYIYIFFEGWPYLYNLKKMINGPCRVGPHAQPSSPSTAPSVPRAGHGPFSTCRPIWHGPAGQLCSVLGSPAKSARAHGVR